MEIIFLLILAIVLFITSLTQIEVDERAGWCALGSFAFIVLIFVLIGAGVIT